MLAITIFISANNIPTTITSIAAADLLSDSRAVINTNFTNLQTNLDTGSDPGHTHTLASGTTGTLAVARGGTGATTAAGAATNLGLGTGDSPTFTNLTLSGLTASEIVGTDASKNLVSLAVATYPSLTELSYVKGVTSALQTQLGLKAPLASPTFTGTVTVPTPFTIGAVSMTATGTELNYVVGVTSAIQTQLGLKSPLASPTFTGVVTIPTPFTLGAISVTATGTELNYVAGVTSALQTQLGLKAPLASPTFTGTVTIPTPFTLGAVSVTATGTELNYVVGVTSAIQTQLGAKAATDQTMYIGTTAVAINRASAALTLAGITLTTPDIGTPSSGIGTNITGIPAANILAGSFGAGAYVISTSLQAATIELGHATDTTLSRVSAGVVAIEGVNIATISATQTLTNKRINPRVQSVADAATVTPAGDSEDCVDITALAQVVTIAAPTGTPVNFQKLIIQFKDNATGRAITWNAAFTPGGVALPTTTTASKILICGFIYSTANNLNKWRLVASSLEA